MARICVIGSNSGRNAGDAAILNSVLHNIRARRPDTQFDVPVPRTSDLYASRYSPEEVCAVPMMPWNFSFRFWGIPTFRSIARSDAMLITDGIIFDVKLFNPAFNFLLFLTLLVPFAKLFRKKVVGLLIGVGPLDSFWGKRFARFVCNRCDALYVREHDSAELLKSVGVNPELIHVFADAAFVDVPVEGERVDAILDENGIDPAQALVGINVNTYLDRWLKSNESVDPDRFARELAAAIDQLAERDDVKVVMILTQIMDVDYAHRLLASCQQRERVAVLGNDRYSAEELMGAMGRLSVFAGMRLHSLILASAMNVPCVGLAYAPKVRHFMSLMGCPENTVELAGFEAGQLVSRFDELRADASARETYATRASELKQKAHDGYDAFCELCLS